MMSAGATDGNISLSVTGMHIVMGREEGRRKVLNE
jgi:hypothetical protein